MSLVPVRFGDPELPDEAAGLLKEPTGKFDRSEHDESNDTIIFRGAQDRLVVTFLVHFMEQTIPVLDGDTQLREILLERSLEQR